jgi:hypothetical protein
MKDDLWLWVVAVIGAILIASMASCLAGYVLPPLLRPALSAPTPSVHAPTIQEIQSAAELATVKYTLSTEASGTNVPQDIRKWFGVREEILLIAHGEVAAGFDLSKMSDKDIWVDGSRVQLHLPAPEILYVRIDNERTHVVYYDKSWFVERDVDLESRARQQAEELLRQAALEGEVLSRAADYGELFFSDWLYQMGFSEVQVIVN